MKSDYTDSNYDVIVIGGGIVGAATAYHLVRDGARTLLIDRHDPGRATSAGAGILAPEISARDDRWFNFAVEAVGYYPQLLSLMASDGITETGYDRCGILLVAVSEDERQPFDEAAEIIFARQRERGRPAKDDLCSVTADQAQALFPPLAQVLKAIYYRDAARVDGRLLESALRAAAATHGLETSAASVEELIVEEGTLAPRRVTGVRMSNTGGAVVDLSADSVVIAGGAWSPTFGEQINLAIPVEPQRGQIAHLELPGEETSGWPIIQGYRGHYMVCWAGDKKSSDKKSNDEKSSEAGNSGAVGRVVVGATREDGSGYQPVTSVEGVMETLGEALRVAPGLASAAVRDVRVGLRPVSPDGLPFVGAVPQTEGIFLATGHGPTGLQLGPFSGKIVADLVLGKEPGIDLAPVRVERFG